MTTVRTRIAPSPSGSLHVGNARTALFSWLLARRHGGRFVLRIEDTDANRITKEAYEGIVEDLRWLGLDWDEGPEVEGPHAPYFQSQRHDIYKQACDRLLEAGAAYRCYCTPAELEAQKRAAQAERRTPGYDGRCRTLSDREVVAFEAAGRPSAVRFRVPQAAVVAFDDAVHGRVTTETAQIPDFVIQRSDGTSPYMLAVSVDDIEMEITHIIRGADHVSNTPKQLLIREALGIADRPVFAHLPLLVTPQGRPLSKRFGDVSVQAYRERGFLPEAMVNYFALLGWSYDDRTNIFSMQELVEKFSLERVGRNPAVFDVAKLEWLNGHYIRQTPAERLAELLVPACEAAGLPAGSDEGRAALRAIAPHIVERLKRLDEAPGMVRFLFEDPAPDERARRVLEGQEAYLVEVARALEGLEEWSAAAIQEALRGLADRRGLKPKQAFQPVRALVTGTLVSPPLFESLEVLGKPRTMARFGGH